MPTILVIGEIGVGKSTLLNILYGNLEAPTKPFIVDAGLDSATNKISH